MNQRALLSILSLGFTLGLMTIIAVPASAQTATGAQPKILNCSGGYNYDGEYYAHADFTGAGPDSEEPQHVEVHYGRHRGPDDSRYAYDAIAAANLVAATDHSASYAFVNGSITLSLDGNSITFLNKNGNPEVLPCTIDAKVRND